MANLPSGLPEHVGDTESLSRFLTQSGHFNSTMAKPAAFMPHPEYRNASVFRIGNDSACLTQTWKDTSDGTRALKAVAFCTAADVRNAGLDVIASEPPPAHANIEGWPWLDDPDLQKARQKEHASRIAEATSILKLEILATPSEGEI